MPYNIIIITIIIIIFILLIKNIIFTEKFLEKKKFYVVISINVHENLDFLFYQLENINKYVNLNYAVVFNCNKTIYELLKKNKKINNLDNIIINNIFLEKKRFHGSLTEGIYSNMLLSLNKFHFKYFLILSSRTIFYNKIDKKILDNLPIMKCKQINEIKKKMDKCLKLDRMLINECLDTRCPLCLKSELGNYLFKNNLSFTSSGHEGLIFNYEGIKNIIKFLNKNKRIKNDIFNFNDCMEELSLQSICCNLNCKSIYIGNGTSTNKNINKLPKNKFVYKVEKKSFV